MDKNKIREIIAKRCARELQDGFVVNLGIGLPTAIPNYIPQGISVVLQSENGLLGMGATPEIGKEDKYLINAGGGFISTTTGAATFDSATSFGIIRGGHVDVTILGAMQVDKKGNLANWMVTETRPTGMGGAMDLLVGARKVILAMEHTAKGKHKILEQCTLPLTAAGRVNMIVTEMGLMDISPEGIVLREVNPEFSISEIQNATGVKLIISDNLKDMRL